MESELALHWEGILRIFEDWVSLFFELVFLVSKMAIFVLSWFPFLRGFSRDTKRNSTRSGGVQPQQKRSDPNDSETQRRSDSSWSMQVGVLSTFW